MWRARSPAAAAQHGAALARLEGEQPPEADFPVHRSLEALRLEDPATMSGCWNPGYAGPGTQGSLAWAGCYIIFVTQHACNKCTLDWACLMCAACGIQSRYNVPCASQLFSGKPHRWRMI